MTNDVQEPSNGLAQEILDYLMERPTAADTFDGIVHWWLLHQRYLMGVTLVRNALDKLVSANQVGQRTNADGTTLYFALSARTESDAGGSN